MRRDRLRTPALVVDLETLDRNIATMAARARALGVALRPHTKSHKSAVIARRLAAAGALGPACATIDEAEAMAAGGLKGIMVTSPMAADHMLERVRALILRGADLLLVADDSRNVGALASLAEAVDYKLQVLVDLDVGQGRTGCIEIGDAVGLAKQIAASPPLEFAGIQAYWGNLQHTMPFEERRARVAVQMQRVKALIDALEAEGLPPQIVSGSGTGTYWIDAQHRVFTEAQPGSFLFLDSHYSTIPLEPDGNPFAPSLFVAASVVTANRPNRVIVNAGWKAFATDSGNPVPVRGAPPGATYRYMGDEHGAVEFDACPAPALGSTIELLVSHCDPTVNLHARYQVVRGEDVVDEWPISARGY